MGDSSGDICSLLCGGCCLVCFSGLGAWCNTQSYGSRGCCTGNRTAGCCGGCCSDSFDEDAFDAQVKKDMEKTRDPNAPASSNTRQLAPTEEMSAQGPAASAAGQ